jgi:hypothetical protein
MHNGEGSGQTQLFFTTEDDCFLHGTGPEPVPVEIGDREGRVVDPFEPDVPKRILFVGMDVAGAVAYEIPVGEHTLCAFASWDAASAPEDIRAARAVVESIRAEPVGSNQVRVVFTTEGGWDTG